MKPENQSSSSIFYFNSASRSDYLCWECGTFLNKDYKVHVINGYPRKLHSLCAFNHIMKSLRESGISLEGAK